MINYIKEEFNLNDLELELCLCAEYLGLKKTYLKKDLNPELNRFSSTYSREDILLFVILDYVASNIEGKNYHLSLGYRYDEGFKDIVIYVKNNPISFKSLEQLIELINSIKSDI